jgi:hypothetical protein
MNDWLDATLKARPVVDDGFADRVIAIGRSQNRNRSIMGAFAAVLALGLLLACGAQLFELALKRAGYNDAEEAAAWRDRERTAFRAAFTRLGALPVLARREGKDASAVLDTVERALLDSPCGARLKAGPVDVDGPEFHSCDTSPIEGLSTYDVWRRVRSHEEKDAAMALARLGVLHLLRAAATGDGATYAAAAKDVEALGRLMLTAVPAGMVAFKALARVTGDIKDRGGDTGGYVAPLSSVDARLVAAVWAGAIRFSISDTNDTDAALVASDRSVLSCGARSAFWKIPFVAGRVLLDDAGCAPRRDVGPWLWFDDTPTLWARIRGALLLTFPGVRSFSSTMTDLPDVSIVKALQPKEGDR